MFQGYYTERKIQDIERYYISLLDECLWRSWRRWPRKWMDEMKNVKFVYCSEFPSWCKTALDLHYFPSSFAFVLEETFKLERNQTFQIKSDFKVSFVLQVTSTYPCLWPSLTATKQTAAESEKPLDKEPDGSWGQGQEIASGRKQQLLWLTNGWCTIYLNPEKKLINPNLSKVYSLVC